MDEDHLLHTCQTIKKQAKVMLIALVVMFCAAVYLASTRTTVMIQRTALKGATRCEQTRNNHPKNYYTTYEVRPYR